MDLLQLITGIWLRYYLLKHGCLKVSPIPEKSTWCKWQLTQAEALDLTMCLVDGSKDWRISSYQHGWTNPICPYCLYKLGKGKALCSSSVSGTSWDFCVVDLLTLKNPWEKLLHKRWPSLFNHMTSRDAHFQIINIWLWGLGFWYKDTNFQTIQSEHYISGIMWLESVSHQPREAMTPNT